MNRVNTSEIVKARRRLTAAAKKRNDFSTQLIMTRWEYKAARASGDLRRYKSLMAKAIRLDKKVKKYEELCIKLGTYILSNRGFEK